MLNIIAIIVSCMGLSNVAIAVGMYLATYVTEPSIKTQQVHIMWWKINRIQFTLKLTYDA